MVGRDKKISRIDSLSKLGDPLTNFIYSLARSDYFGVPQGKKISNSALSIALNESGLRDLAPSRLDKKILGDFVEGLIYFCWDKGDIEIKEASEILVKHFDEGINRRRKEKIVAGKAFAELLKYLDRKTDLNQFYEEKTD